MFVRAANPVWYFPDLTGLPLNDEYFAFFLTNTLPYLPQNVYRDPQGLAVWDNPLEFFPNGTLPDNLYFDPSLVYRIEIRQGNSQTDPLIYEINNFIPGDGATPDNNSLAILGNENQVSNGQFSIINFVSPLTIAIAGTYSIAPGWDLVLTGAGSTTLTQLILSGSQNQINNPPFALRINNTGWTESYLRQRLLDNGAIWANGAITMSLTGRAQTTTETVSLIYSPNAPGTPEIVATGSLGTGSYEVLQGAIDLPASTNTSLSNVAYVDLIVQLPVAGIVDISNIQAIGQSSALPSNFDPATDIPSYQQEPEERAIDHLFHYYKSQLVLKPKKSLLVGWNFPLNPFQFITTTVTTAASETQYIADQTILHQEAASQVQTGKNTVGERQNLLVKAVTAATTTRFALIQYIDPASIRPYWSYVLSAFARARIFTSHATTVRLKARLIYRSSLPPTISNTEPIASWPAASDPVFAAGWTALAPLNDPAYTLPNAYATDEVSGENAYPGFSFDQFQMPNSDNASMTLGIVVYTMDNMNATAASEDSIAFDKISLIPSYFGADANAETFDDCLRECQFYYEKSYDNSVLPGTASSNGLLFAEQLALGSSPISLIGRSFEFEFNTIKRTASSAVTIYSTDGTINDVRGFISNNGAGEAGANIAVSNWTQAALGQKAVFHRANTIAALHTLNQVSADPEAYIQYHYTVDARLGV